MKVTSYIYNFLIPRTLVSRFILIITIPTVIAQLVAIYIFYDRHWSNIISSTSRTVANEVKLVSDIYDKHGFQESQKQASILDIKLKYSEKNIPKNQARLPSSTQGQDLDPQL